MVMITGQEAWVKFVRLGYCRHRKARQSGVG